MKIQLSSELQDCLEEHNGRQAFNMFTYSKLYTEHTYILSKVELKSVIDELLQIEAQMKD